MNEPSLHVRIEQVPPHRQFAWVIVEQRSPTEAVELGASLQTYEHEEDALLAGECMLKNSCGFGVAHPSYESRC